MPLSGGTAGAHDDAMHQGSAKRDVVDGVAALDSSGFLLAVGAGIQFPRSGSDDVHIYERTSGEEAYAFHRTGANDYTFYIKESNVWKRFQTESMKDVNSGIAALDGGGNLLAPGNSITLARNVGDDLGLKERTSSENVYYIHRVAANDYIMYLMVGGVAVSVLTAAVKDVANGIAGLDANVLLPLALLPACLEEYINHLGAVDNFTETAVGGAGTATPDAANHEMDLVGPSGNVGSAIMRTKSQYTFGSQILVGSFLVQNIGVSDGAGRNFEIGFSDGFATGGAAQTALVYYDGTNWYRKNANGLPGENAIISDISSGDTITIVATSSILRFFVNGISVATTATNIPTGAMNCGVAVDRRVGAGATNLTASVDMMSLRRYL